MRNLDEHRLMRRIAGGDSEALRSVHTEYGPFVFGALRRILPDRMSAEDVFQQVMTEVWLRADRFDARRGSLASWLLAIARSRAIDELRRKRPEPLDPHAMPDAGDIDPGYEAMLADWELAHLLHTLPAEEREVLELRFTGDKTQAEIAKATGLPLGSVKTYTSRALSRLAGVLKSSGDALDGDGES